MAKRRAEATLSLDSPRKRLYFPHIYGVDMQLESTAADGPYTDTEEADSCLRVSLSASGKRAREALKEPSSGSFLDDSRSWKLPGNKRPREEGVDSRTVTTAYVKTAEDLTDEVGTFNSFQYWRAPLPELDLSLLQDASKSPPKTEKSKTKDDDTTADAMET